MNNLHSYLAYNKVSKAPYRPFVAKVYGEVRGVPFEQAFKSEAAARKIARKHNGFLVSLVH